MGDKSVGALDTAIRGLKTHLYLAMPQHPFLHIIPKENTTISTCFLLEYLYTEVILYESVYEPNYFSTNLG